MGTITVLYHIDPAVNMRRFWSVRERGRYADVQWGRMDTDGQELTYTYHTADERAVDIDRIVASKLRKGYK